MAWCLVLQHGILYSKLYRLNFSGHEIQQFYKESSTFRRHKHAILSLWTCMYYIVMRFICSSFWPHLLLFFFWFFLCFCSAFCLALTFEVNNIQHVAWDKYFGTWVCIQFSCFLWYLLHEFIKQASIGRKLCWSSVLVKCCLRGKGLSLILAKGLFA